MVRFFVLFMGILAMFFQKVSAGEPSREELLKKDWEQVVERSKQIKPFYDLPEGVDIQDVTDKLLDSPHVAQLCKDAIHSTGRRIFVFVYPSDGLKIKGYISFVPTLENQPIIFVLRGGNREFSLPNPGSDIACLRNYTILSTTYRGGISEGRDEYGGQDVNDVKNLVDFLPEIEKKLNIPLSNQKMFMVGGSRGGLQMFLALGRFPELQNRVSKIVSLSGMLDIRYALQDRQDMKQMFIDDFGLIENVNEAEWLDLRDPLLAARHLRPDLPILIIQGTADIRVPLEEGYHMIQALEANGNSVTYWEVDGADHCLSNRSDRWEMIADLGGFAP